MSQFLLAGVRDALPLFERTLGGQGGMRLVWRFRCDSALPGKLAEGSCSDPPSFAGRVKSVVRWWRAVPGRLMALGSANLGLAGVIGEGVTGAVVGSSELEAGGHVDRGLGP
ncbi:hypothetical protein CA85_47690 [Allorhodopirellula solitaria]|uniref:Uncharacterized protein n=1 Tax=Allorhodopirellula solitaria TaxID=2527987 RepID=A0A5C5X0R0_9BACT|nr:hypothetical protein CA85_47690 [Allorhodopirellula solitaria]